MFYACRFFPYQRYFKKPLQTSQGTLTIRQGIIIHLIDADGRVGQGEIAPLPWFGSETFAQAKTFCQDLRGNISQAEIFRLPEHLSACQFAFESAWRDLSHPSPVASMRSSSYLLPAGRAALTSLQARGGADPCYKWKIGVEELNEELAILWELLAMLTLGSQLRLDANGGLTLPSARAWLRECDRTDKIEFLEQPLGAKELATMLKLREEFRTPLALDESVANLQQLQDCYQQGWRGIFVIKAAIAGYPHLISEFCQEYALDTVFSSVFETQVGRQAVLALAEEVMGKERALGFGVEHLLGKCQLLL